MFYIFFLSPATRKEITMLIQSLLNPPCLLMIYWIGKIGFNTASSLLHPPHIIKVFLIETQQIVFFNNILFIISSIIIGLCY